MIAQILKKEIIEQITSYRFVVMFAMAMSLIAVSSTLSIEKYTQDIAHYHASVRQHSEEMKNIKVYSRISVKVDEEPEVLGILSRGISNQFAPTVEISRTKTPEVKAAGSEDNQFLALATDFDITRVVAIFFSLLGILLGFDVVNKESRDGTMKQMLANSVPRYQVLLAKCLSGLCVIGSSIVFALAILLLHILISPKVGLNNGEIVRFILFGGVSFVYVTLFYLIGVLFSSVARNPGTSLAFSIFAWILLAVVWPTASRSIGRRFVNVPSFEQMKDESGFEPITTAEVKEMYGDFPSIGAAMYRIGNDGSFIYTTFSGHSLEAEDEDLVDMYEKGISINAKVMEQSNMEWNIRSAFQDKQIKQWNAVHRLSSLSPAYVFSNVSAIICRTGIYSHRHLAQNLRDYRNSINQWLKEIDAMHSHKWYVEQDDLNLSGFPVMVQRKIPLRNSVRHTAIPIGLLFSLCFVTFFLAHYSFFKSDIF